MWPWSRRSDTPPVTHLDGSQTGVPTSTGPAAGNGYEILLQGFNWESCSHGDWYQVRRPHTQWDVSSEQPIKHGTNR